MAIDDILLLYTPDQWIGVGVGMGLLMIMFVYWISYRKKMGADRDIRRTLAQLGKKFIKDAMLPDGLDGFIFVDYIMLMPGGILIFYLVDIPGYIFGAMKMDEWTQMIDNRSNRFKNPLFALGEAMRVVRAHVPNTRVEGRVVFWHSTQFPKGTPENVCLMHTLHDDIKSLQVEGDEYELQAAWDKIQMAVTQTWNENLYHQKITRFDRVS